MRKTRDGFLAAFFIFSICGSSVLDSSSNGGPLLPNASSGFAVAMRFEVPAEAAVTSSVRGGADPQHNDEKEDAVEVGSGEQPFSTVAGGPARDPSTQEAAAQEEQAAPLVFRHLRYDPLPHHQDHEDQGQRSEGPEDEAAGLSPPPPQPHGRVDPPGLFSSRLERLERYLESDSRPISIGSLDHLERGKDQCCALPCKYAWKAKPCKDGPLCTRCHLCKYTKSRSSCRSAQDSVVKSQKCSWKKSEDPEGAPVVVDESSSCSRNAIFPGGPGNNRHNSSSTSPLSESVLNGDHLHRRPRAKKISIEDGLAALLAGGLAHLAPVHDPRRVEPHELISCGPAPARPGLDFAPPPPPRPAEERWPRPTSTRQRTSISVPSSSRMGEERKTAVAKELNPFLTANAASERMPSRAASSTTSDSGSGLLRRTPPASARRRVDHFFFADHVDHAQEQAQEQQSGAGHAGRADTSPVDTRREAPAPQPEAVTLQQAGPKAEGNLLRHRGEGDEPRVELPENYAERRRRYHESIATFLGNENASRGGAPHQAPFSLAQSSGGAVACGSRGKSAQMEEFARQVNVVLNQDRAPAPAMTTKACRGGREIREEAIKRFLEDGNEQGLHFAAPARAPPPGFRFDPVNSKNYCTSPYFSNPSLPSEDAPDFDAPYPASPAVAVGSGTDAFSTRESSPKDATTPLPRRSGPLPSTAAAAMIETADEHQPQVSTETTVTVARASGPDEFQLGEEVIAKNYPHFCEAAGKFSPTSASGGDQARSGIDAEVLEPRQPGSAAREPECNTMLPPGVDIVSELWWSTTRRMIRTAIGDYKQLQSTTTGKGAKEEAERLLRGHYLAEARKGRLPVMYFTEADCQVEESRADRDPVADVQYLVRTRTTRGRGDGPGRPRRHHGNQEQEVLALLLKKRTT